MVEISVLLSVKNGERFLHEAIESILDQSISDFEFIILDNSSSDRSVEIIESFGDPRIRLIKNEIDLGQTRALNKGLGLAQGRFIARMDADDISLKDRFKKQLDCFSAHPKTAVVGTWHEEIDEKGRFLKHMNYPTDPLEIKCHLLSDGDLTRRCLAHPTVMIKTDVLRKTGGYNESIRFAQDYELWTRLFVDCEIRNVPEYLFQYRASQKSTSNANRDEMTRELDRIVEALLRRVWPGIDEKSVFCLLTMLRNRRAAGMSAVELHAAFDAFFQRLFPGETLSDRHIALRERIKMYYWPKLPYRSGLGRMPLMVADTKFHKNIAKTLLRR